MAVTGTTNNAAVTAADTAGTVSRTVNSELGKDEFLQILVSQLRNQDPLNPMEDKDFIAQMAQFSVLEQVQNLNSGFSFSQAISLVGKNVYTTMTGADGSTQEIFGTVTSVASINGLPCLEVNGQYIPYDQNIVVYDYADPLAPQPGDQTTDTTADQTETTEKTETTQTT